MDAVDFDVCEEEFDVRGADTLGFDNCVQNSTFTAWMQLISMSVGRIRRS